MGVVDQALIRHRALAVAVLGGAQSDQAAELVVRWCRTTLGSEVVAMPWAAAGSGLVVAADLADGREVVIKCRPAAQRRRIAESRAVQEALADAGLPVSRPIGPLAPIGATGVAGAEVRIDGGTPIDARAEGSCELLADLLHQVVVTATERTSGDVALHEPWGIALPADELWPDPPHDPGFDLVGTSGGAEWIDASARGFRARLVAGASGRPRAVGHVDWRAEHVLVDSGGAVAGIFD